MRSRLHVPLLVAPHAALALVVSLRFTTTPDPRGYGTHEQLGLGPCTFRDWLGGPCPTCGVTTAASHLVHGDVAAAWQTQPLGVLAPAAAVAWLLWSWRVHHEGGDLSARWAERGRGFWSALAVVVLVSWWVASVTAPAPG